METSIGIKSNAHEQFLFFGSYGYVLKILPIRLNIDWPTSRGYKIIVSNKTFSADKRNA